MNSMVLNRKRKERDYARFAGRLLNAASALILIAIFAPFMALIALLIYLIDGAPILYRGKRLGKNGQIFVMYKFRTLDPGAEKAIGGRLMKESEGYITPLGRFLRCFKLDELPQLFNILKGDMNFVGPRPVRRAMARNYEKIVPGYKARFEIKPGLTGLAQLRGGYYCPPGRKTRYDIFYIRKQSFSLDLKLMLLTAVRLVVSPGCLKSGNRRPIGYYQRSYEKCSKCHHGERKASREVA